MNDTNEAKLVMKRLQCVIRIMKKMGKVTNCKRKSKASWIVKVW